MIRIVKHIKCINIDKDLDWVSLILGESGNTAIISLMDRVPVHIVDSAYMSKWFDRNVKPTDGSHNLIVFLFKLVGILKERIAVLESEEKDSEDDFLDRLNALRADFSDIYGDFLSDRDCPIKQLNRVNKLKEKIVELEKRIEEQIKKTEQNPPVELLGVYSFEINDNQMDLKRRAIYICPERIRKSAGAGDLSYRYLLAKVTIHEFCHAYMDIDPGSGEYNTSKGRLMEESMANVMTLHVIETYTIKRKTSMEFFDYSKEFMKHQPAEYALAVDMWDCGIRDYDLWSWNKHEILNSPLFAPWHSEATSTSHPNLSQTWAALKKDILATQDSRYCIVKINSASPIAILKDKDFVRCTFDGSTAVNATSHRQMYLEFIRYMLGQGFISPQWLSDYQEKTHRRRTSLGDWEDVWGIKVVKQLSATDIVKEIKEIMKEGASNGYNGEIVVTTEW